MPERGPFMSFPGSPEIIRLAAKMCVRLPLRNVEDRMHERGIDGGRETVRLGKVDGERRCMSRAADREGEMPEGSIGRKKIGPCAGNAR